MVVLAIVLLLDWRKDKKLFLHVAKPVELIRSENKDQVERREQRNPDVVYSPTRSSQKGLVKEQVAKRNQFETDRKKYPANGFEVKPLNVPSVFQSENSKPQTTKHQVPHTKAESNPYRRVHRGASKTCTTTPRWKKFLSSEIIRM